MLELTQCPTCSGQKQAHHAMCFGCAVNGPARHVEHVLNGQAVFRPEKARTYQCPSCGRPVFSMYEGDEMPTIECRPLPQACHVLTWVLS